MWAIPAQVFSTVLICPLIKRQLICETVYQEMYSLQMGKRPGFLNFVNAVYGLKPVNALN